MKVYTEEFTVRTRGKGTYEISEEIAATVAKVRDQRTGR